MQAGPEFQPHVLRQRRGPLLAFVERRLDLPARLEVALVRGEGVFRKEVGEEIVGGGWSLLDQAGWSWNTVSLLQPSLLKQQCSVGMEREGQ
eukprot:SAG22_NODE_8187_length_676_cov_0.840555_2_plen_91_part_01